MKKPRIAIPSFPGSNGEVDNLKTLRRCGFDCFVFRWNESKEKLADVDGYFFGAGFSYEDRGRSGMVAARDPLFAFMHEEACRGKVIIGNCNGAQVLVESGLIPLGNKLAMALAHNAIRSTDGSYRSTGFINQWIWMKPSCARDRCATSNWSEPMHIPIAHGEGRFTTKDRDVLRELEKRDQIAFRYCDQKGNVSEDQAVTPNGSEFAIAGICNTAGNVVAIMPHPERTTFGDEYFLSMKQWILSSNKKKPSSTGPERSVPQDIAANAPLPVEIFIDTIITNNEERTVEKAARRYIPHLSLKQYKYIGLVEDLSHKLLSSLSFFNPHKEIAFIRKQGNIMKWNSEKKKAERATSNVLQGIALLRTDIPDMGAVALDPGSRTGICYDCRNVAETELCTTSVCEIFSNPHSSTLERVL